MAASFPSKCYGLSPPVITTFLVTTFTIVVAIGQADVVWIPGASSISLGPPGHYSTQSIVDTSELPGLGLCSLPQVQRGVQMVCLHKLMYLDHAHHDGLNQK